MVFCAMSRSELFLKRQDFRAIVFVLLHQVGEQVPYRCTLRGSLRGELVNTASFGVHLLCLDHQSIRALDQPVQFLPDTCDAPGLLFRVLLILAQCGLGIETDARNRVAPSVT